MQYEQRPDGLHPLPKPSIDTGAGLERLLVILQKVTSVFEIDEMARLIDKASEIAKVSYGKDPQKDLSLRILAEHARAMTFLISDGVFPSNEDRGYVLRRIMRRAIRHAHLLGVERVACPEMVDEVVAMMHTEYPDLGRQSPLRAGGGRARRRTISQHTLARHGDIDRRAESAQSRRHPSRRHSLPDARHLRLSSGARARSCRRTRHISGCGGFQRRNGAAKRTRPPGQARKNSRQRRPVG